MIIINKSLKYKNKSNRPNTNSINISSQIVNIKQTSKGSKLTKNIINNPHNTPYHNINKKYNN